jgi:hypothetical protein
MATATQRKPLTPAQQAEVERLRALIKSCDRFHYTASAEALRKKLRRLLTNASV